MVGVAIVAALSGITFAISRMKPAAPAVERNLVWIDTVKRGEMLREVRGLGTLVPEQISWIAARSAGRVDRASNQNSVVGHFARRRSARGGYGLRRCCVFHSLAACRTDAFD
jgi:hypothetical protein